MNYSKYEDYTVRARAGKNNKPRTKKRPPYHHAVTAFVTEIHRGRFYCYTDDSTTIIAVLARELGRYPIAVGDTVDLVGDISGKKGTLARIIRVHDREYHLIRSIDDTTIEQQLIAAGSKQSLIVTATNNPLPRAGFIYRAIIATVCGNMTPIIAVTKTDLGTIDTVKDLLIGSDIPIISAGINDNIDELRTLLSGTSTVLIGHSGVGKSTLINRLIPSANRKIGEVSTIGKGKHTSTFSQAIPLPQEGWIIDTPGIRTLGLAYLNPKDIFHSFADLSEQIDSCPKGCLHREYLYNNDCALHNLPNDRQVRINSLRNIAETLYLAKVKRSNL